MAVTYSLGKNATITGVANTSVRSVTATVEGSQIDVTKRGDTTRKFKSGWRDATVEIEMLEEGPEAGDELSISVPNAGVTGTMVVTQVTRNEPLDDVITWNVTCKMKSASGS